ncbi:MAG: hypothetical protein EP330_14540 [Deltaproteobacteria bacterium]|nr:MAG: hypothetical protein EP330_14540 [Deltaproteobacteria bacterium]
MDAILNPVALGVLIGAVACGAVIFRSTRWGIVLTSLYALGANAYLFKRKFASAQETDAICNVSDTINCDVVNNSAASEMFGVPITLLGAGFFAGLLLAAFLAKDDDKKIFQATALFSILNVVYSAYLGLQAYQLGAVCLFCIAIYIANLLLLWGGLKGLKEAGGTLFEDLGKFFGSTAFMVITVVFGLVVLMGGTAWTTEQARLHSSLDVDPTRKPLPTEELERVFHAPGGPVRLDGTEPVYGDPDAPYMLVEWADYGCPHCARAAVELKRLLADNPQIQLRFKVFPLDGKCNPALQPGDGTRCDAAKAAECGHAQGKFWEMQELLFKNQGYFALDELRHMAGQAGLDLPTFDACMTDPATEAAVIADAKAGDDAKIFGTPTIFLQGTHGSSFVQPEGIPGALRLIEAHSAGANMPEPPPWKPPPGMH